MRALFIVVALSCAVLMAFACFMGLPEAGVQLEVPEYSAEVPRAEVLLANNVEIDALKEMCRADELRTDCHSLSSSSNVASNAITGADMHTASKAPSVTGRSQTGV